MYGVSQSRKDSDACENSDLMTPKNSNPSTQRRPSNSAIDLILNSPYNQAHLTYQRQIIASKAAKKKKVLNEEYKGVFSSSSNLQKMRPGELQQIIASPKNAKEDMFRNSNSSPFHISQKKRTIEPFSGKHSDQKLRFPKSPTGMVFTQKRGSLPAKYYGEFQSPKFIERKKDSGSQNKNRRENENNTVASTTANSEMLRRKNENSSPFAAGNVAALGIFRNSIEELPPQEDCKSQTTTRLAEFKKRVKTVLAGYQNKVTALEIENRELKAEISRLRDKKESPFSN